MIDRSIHLECIVVTLVRLYSLTYDTLCNSNIINTVADGLRILDIIGNTGESESSCLITYLNLIRILYKKSCLIKYNNIHYQYLEFNFLYHTDFNLYIIGSICSIFPPYNF